MKVILLSFLLVVFHNPVLYSQASDYGSNTTVYELASSEAKDYQLKVTLPRGYDKNKTYKALYYLDAWWLSELVLGSYAVLNLSEQIDELVLVGITIDGSVLDWNKQRTFDFTPSIYDMPVDQMVGLGGSAIKLDSNTTGGADVFLEFLESKVLSFIDHKIPNLDPERGFVGHSFSGLFGFYTLMKKPELFTDYLIISPSLWWNNPEMLDPELFNDFTMQKRSRKLYVAYGEKETNWIVRSNIQMDSIINNLETVRLNYQFIAYEKANHNSVLSRAIYDGLLYLYKK